MAALTALALLLLPAAPAAASALNGTASPGPAAAASDRSPLLDEQVRAWVDELAKQPQFADWREAEADIRPLGPGTHGWIVVLEGAEGPVGYLVVHAAEDGSFRLGEYGTGPNVLFSAAALRTALLENGLIAAEDAPYEATERYAHPLAAVWEVAVGNETYWLDAKTGEQLPLDARTAAFAASPAADGYEPLLHAARHIDAAHVRESFDPYERLPWLLGETPFPSGNDNKAQRRIASGLHLRYVSEPFGDAVLYALPVIGFHRWDGGRLDLALDMSGTRYIPFDALMHYGKLYR